MRSQKSALMPMVICLHILTSFSQNNHDVGMSFQLMKVTEFPPVVVVCSSGPVAQLISMNVYEKLTDIVTASYVKNTNFCRSISDFSYCFVDDKSSSVTMKTFILTMMEGERRDYGCNVTQLTDDARPHTTSYSTRVIIEKTTSTATTTTTPSVTTTEHVKDSIVQSSTFTSGPDVPLEAFIAVLVLLILLIIINIIIFILHLRSNDKLCKKETPFSSAGTLQRPRAPGAKPGSTLDIKSHGWVNGDTLTRVASRPRPPSCPAPELPWGGRVMQYEKPLPLSDADIGTLSEDNGYTSATGSTKGYKEPWGSLDDEIKSRLSSLRANSRLCHVPGFEGNTSPNAAFPQSARTSPNTVSVPSPGTSQNTSFSASANNSLKVHASNQYFL